MKELHLILAVLAACCLSSAVYAEASGPDFFAVNDGPGDGQLQLRAGPSSESAVTGAVSANDTVRNLGCEGEGDTRWCRVGSLADDSVDGWILSRYLTEASPPAATGVGRSLSDGDGQSMPSVYQRNTGEFEVNFKGGCGVLFDAGAKRITAGSSCSEKQLKAADQAVTAVKGN